MEGEVKPSLDELLKTTPEELQKEKELGQRGSVAERKLKIEDLEKTRMQAGLENALQERLKKLKPEDIEQRKQTAHRYFSEQMTPPSYESGPYAAARWRNLFEMIRRVVDVQQDSSLVPDVDPRVPFVSNQLQKEAIIKRVLAERIQDSLGKEKAFSPAQLFDCFTNVSQEQLDTVTHQIALSGLTILPESPNEHWTRLTQGVEASKNA